MLTRNTTRGLHSLWIIAAAAACNDQGPESCEPQIQATSSGTVQFSWVPSCEASELLVHPTNGQDAVLWWLVADPEMHSIEAPVEYGKVPAGARSPSPAWTLEGGTIYEVQLMGAGQDHPTLGSRRFTVP